MPGKKRIGATVLDQRHVPGSITAYESGGWYGESGRGGIIGEARLWKEAWPHLMVYRVQGPRQSASNTVTVQQAPRRIISTQVFGIFFLQRCLLTVMVNWTRRTAGPARASVVVSGSVTTSPHPRTHFTVGF